MDKRKNKGGRPTMYSQERLDLICEGLSKGIPLTVICSADGMPTDNTVRDWEKRADVGAEVSMAIARAREAGHDAIALEALAIADDGSRDYKENADGHPVIDHDHVSRARLRVDTRLKLLAKWSPRYRENVTVGGDKDAPITVVVRRLSDD